MSSLVKLTCPHSALTKMHEKSYLILSSLFSVRGAPSCTGGEHAEMSSGGESAAVVPSSAEPIPPGAESVTYNQRKIWSENSICAQCRANIPCGLICAAY